MAKKKIELFIYVHSEKEFEHMLKNNMNNLICAEIYCEFAGHCTALDRLFTIIKFDWSNGNLILLKVPADEIQELERFRGYSEPLFMFILRGKTTKVFRGVHGIRFSEVVKRELHLYNKEKEGIVIDRPFYEINEPTPDEMLKLNKSRTLIQEWLNSHVQEKANEIKAIVAKKEERQAARKLHRAQLMVPHLASLNFVLFWPHCFHAHPELYERWDVNNIIMVGREELELTEEKAKDILYAGDAPLNEASMMKLLSGPALAICFRILDTDKHFASLVRKILYQDIPQYEEGKSVNEQLPRITAFDYYKSFSLSKEQVWQKRREEWEKRKEEKIEKRERRLSEMQRLARLALEEAIEAKKLQREKQRLELLKTGNLAALDQFDREPDYNSTDINVPEALSDDSSVEECPIEDENEHFPPAGQLIPGFYAPPNDVAKANGLAILFPKIVADHVTPQPEFLPPHVLVLLEISKRHNAIDLIAPYKTAIIHMGIFKVISPYQSVHIVYSVKQYDTLDNSTEKTDDVRLAFMLSIKRDLPLLHMMDLHPVHVSRDTARGEDECAAMFPVGYSDDYDEFEDFL